MLILRTMHWTNVVRQPIYPRETQRRHWHAWDHTTRRRDLRSRGYLRCRPASPPRGRGNFNQQSSAGASNMEIWRFGTTEPTGDIPLISLATMHGNIVYLCGITADPANPGDIGDQTRQV